MENTFVQQDTNMVNIESLPDSTTATEEQEILEELITDDVSGTDYLRSVKYQQEKEELIGDEVTVRSGSKIAKWIT